MDWSFAFSCVTAATALIALFFSALQVKQSNKQHLFDRRIKAWSICCGLLELYKKEEKLLMRDVDEPAFGNKTQFMFLTNNSFLYEVSDVVSHTLEGDNQRVFLQKMEVMKAIALEITLIFRRKDSHLLESFLYAYQSLLFVMYQYQIVLDKMTEMTNASPCELKKAAEIVHEEKYRKDFLNARETLKNSYEMLVQKEIPKKIEKQIQLSWLS